MESSRWLGGAMLALLAAVSCGMNDEIAMGPLSGRIGGKPWTVATALSEPGFSSADLFAVTMYGDSFTACAGASASGDRLLVTVPSAPGDYALDLLPATFFVATGNQNLITKWGH